MDGDGVGTMNSTSALVPEVLAAYGERLDVFHPDGRNASVVATAGWPTSWPNRPSSTLAAKNLGLLIGLDHRRVT